MKVENKKSKRNNNNSSMVKGFRYERMDQFIVVFGRII